VAVPSPGDSVSLHAASEEMSKKGQARHRERVVVMKKSPG
jgi:hypothetical protein